MDHLVVKKNDRKKWRVPCDNSQGHLSITSSNLNKKVRSLFVYNFFFGHIFWCIVQVSDINSCVLDINFDNGPSYILTMLAYSAETTWFATFSNHITCKWCNCNLNTTDKVTWNWIIFSKWYLFSSFGFGNDDIHLLVSSIYTIENF